MASENKNIPSASPSKPKVEALMERFNILLEVSDKYNKTAGEIAEDIFSHIINIGDDEVRKGEIPKSGNEDLDRYIAPLNELFKLANEGGNGSIRHLDRESAEELSPKIVAMARCLNLGEGLGNQLLDTLCEIVNQEINDRIPSQSIKVNRVAQLFGVPNKGVEINRGSRGSSNQL